MTEAKRSFCRREKKKTDDGEHEDSWLKKNAEAVGAIRGEGKGGRKERDGKDGKEVIKK